MSRTDRDTSDLLRDIFALPDRERIKILERLREDLADAAPPSKSDEINSQQKTAIEVFNNVAEHLRYDHDLEKLMIKMREFDAAPYRVREGVKARQIAKFFGSWHLAKAAAIGESLEPSPAQHRRRRLVIARNRRYARFQQGLYEWIATDPEKTSHKSYNDWRSERNKNLADDELPFVTSHQITSTWKRLWADIVADTKAGTLAPPVVTRTEDPYISERGKDLADTESHALDSNEDGERVFDPDLVSRRLHEALEARGLTAHTLSKQTEIPEVTIRGVEDGKSRERIYFSTIVRLANSLDVPVEWFATPDGKSGLPPRRNRRPKKSPRKNRRSRRG